MRNAPWVAPGGSGSCKSMLLKEYGRTAEVGEARHQETKANAWKGVTGRLRGCDNGNVTLLRQSLDYWLGNETMH